MPSNTAAATQIAAAFTTIVAIRRPIIARRLDGDSAGRLLLHLGLVTRRLGRPGEMACAEVRLVSGRADQRRFVRGADLLRDRAPWMEAAAGGRRDRAARGAGGGGGLRRAAAREA